MNISYTKLADIQYIPSTADSIYANPAGARTHVKSLFLYNNNTTAETVELYNVPDSSGALGTAGAGNRFFRKNLAADESFVIELEYPFVLIDPNDSIQAVTTTADMVTVQVMGDKDV